MTKGRALAAALAALMLVAIVLVVNRRSGQVAIPDGVVVVTGRPEIARAPVADVAPPPDGPGERGAMAPDADRSAVLKALRLPEDAVLQQGVSLRGGGPVVCGTAAAPSLAETQRRFVYVGVAGLAALDNGGQDFGDLWTRFCAA